MSVLTAEIPLGPFRVVWYFALGMFLLTVLSVLLVILTGPFFAPMSDLSSTDRHAMSFRS